jgi:WD40 repeat protein
MPRSYTDEPGAEELETMRLNAGPATAESEAALALRWIRSARERLLAFLFGDDVFVSYARADTTSYAAAFARKLTDKNLVCYLDQWTTTPAKRLPPKLKTAIRRSRIFVLLASEAALNSAPIEQEIDEFLPTKGPFLLIALTSRLRHAAWYHKVEGAAVTRDVDQLANGPSDAVIDRIHDSYSTQTRNRRQVRASWLVLLTTVLVLSVIIGRATILISSAGEAADLAEVRQREAQRRFRALNAAAAAVRDYDEAPRNSLMQALDAFSMQDIPETRSTLGSTLFRDPYLRAFIPITSEDPRIPQVVLEFTRGDDPVLLLASGTELQVWRVGSLAPEWTFENKDAIAAVAGTSARIAISPRYMNGQPEYIRLLDRHATGPGRVMPVVTVPHVDELAFATSERLIGFASDDGIAEWDLLSGKERNIARWNSTNTKYFAVSPAGDRVAVTAPTTGTDATELLVLTRSASGRWSRHTIPSQSGLRALAFEDDDHLRTVYDDGSVVRRAVSSSKHDSLPSERIDFNDIRLGPSGRVLIARDGGLHAGGSSPSIARQLSRSTQLSPHAGNDQLALDDAGRLLATPIQAGYVGVWDLRSAAGVQERTEWGSAVAALSRDPRSGVLASLSWSKYKAIVHVMSLEGMRRFDVDLSFGVFPTMSSDPANDCGDCSLGYLGWQVASVGKPLQRITVTSSGSVRVQEDPAIPDFRTRLALSADGSYLAHCDPEFELLQMGGSSKGAPVTFNAPVDCNALSPFAFSSDGRVLAIVGGGQDHVNFWDVTAQRQIGGFSEAHFKGIQALAFSPDGRMVAVGFNDGRVNLWAIEWAPEVGCTRLTPPTSLFAGTLDAPIRGLLFSADGSSLYALSEQRVYEMSTSLEAWVRLAKQRLLSAAD